MKNVKDKMYFREQVYVGHKIVTNVKASLLVTLSNLITVFAPLSKQCT